MRVGQINWRSERFPQDLFGALHATGFAVLEDHPLPAELIAELHAQWLVFFAGTDKHSYRNQGDGQWGYWPDTVSETAVGATQRDLKEFFQMGPDTDLPSPLAALVADYRSATWALGLELLDALEQALPAGKLAVSARGLSHRLSEHESLLRIVHYPPLSSEGMSAGAVRAAAHEDINLLTILPVAEEPGLQVQDQQGHWHPVHGAAGHIIVNAGDMLAEATGGFMRSTSHRVVNPEDPAARARSRIAAPYFLAPEPDTVLSERYTAGSYLAERLALIGLASPSTPAEPPR